MRDAGKRAKKRVWGAIERRLIHGLPPEDYIQIEQLYRFGRQAYRTLQHLVDLPQAAYSAVVSKVAYVVVVGLRTFFLGTFLSAVAAAVIYLRRLYHNARLQPGEVAWTFGDSLRSIVDATWFKSIAVITSVVVFAIAVVKIYRRLAEVEPGDRSRYY
jgi:hypothetical protein